MNDDVARQIEPQSENVDADLSPETPAVVKPSNESQPEPTVPVWPVLNRRMVWLTLVVAVLFAAVISAAYVFGLRAKAPSHQEPPIPISVLEKTVPDEIGEVSLFVKRFAANAARYEKKYHGRVLEMVGVVEEVTRTPAGYFEATLMLANQSNQVYRACFRFMPEQTEAIYLARGTLAVLKGRYSSYQAGIVNLFPAVVVYHAAQSATQY